MTDARIERKSNTITVHEADGSTSQWRRVAISLPVIASAQEETRGLNLYLWRPLADDVGTITQWFGEHPADYARFGLAGHNGIDYGVAEGEPVMAAHDGICTPGQDDAGYGLYVRVENAQCQTIYAHLSHIVVGAGQRVVAGDVIGASGNTGNSTGPHLHFGLRIRGMRNDAYSNYVDPAVFRA